MAQKVKVSTYIKNVGKSFGYSVREVASEYAPIAASTAKDLKSTARDIKISMQEIRSNSISSSTRDFSKGENFLTNTLDDLRTGKWYNQERKDKAENEMFGFDSFDFDFDDEDWGDDSDGADTSSILEHDEMSTRQIVSSMGQVGSEISKSLGYTSAKSAEYIVANNNASTRALYDLNAKGFNQVSSILMNMSGSLAGLVQLGEPLAAHMQNSSVFYVQTTESLSRISEDVNKMSSNLQILVDRTAYMDKKGSVKENKSGFGRFMSGGDFSLSSYMDMVKENVKDQADSVKSIISMMEMMMGKNGKNASLTEAIVKGTVDKLIPTITKDIAKQFDEALSASLGNGLMRAGKSARNKGFLASMLADMLLPKEVVKNGVNPSSYEKGPVSWDGIARQSLTYVIPTYLAQMTALLAGVNDEKDYQYYDFKSGKFTTKRVYQRDKEVRDRAKARSVGGEFEDIALKSTGNKQMQKEIEEFFYQAMMNGGDFYDIKKGKKDADWRKKYGNISEETVDLLLQVLEANNGKGPNKNRNAASKWETRNNQAIADKARRMQEEELLGYSFENRFADGTSDFILRSAVGGGRVKGRGTGERNQSVYRTPFNASTESVSRGNGWKQNNDGTYTVGPNDAIITAADFGKWLDAFESGDTKTARKIENTKAMKDTKDKASNMAKDIGSKAMDKLGMSKAGSKVTNVMDLLERGRDVIQTPMYAVTMALDSLNRGINNLFWGDGSEEGVIDKLKKKISSVWDKIKDKFDDLFGSKSYRALKDMGLSDQFVDIVRTVDKKGYIRYYGIDANGKKTPVSKEVGQTYEEQTRKKTLKESIGNEWTKIKESFKNQQQAARQRREALTADLAKFKEMSAGLDNGNAATGRQVTKAGFAIVSEGEMIVPSEFNPYYHGATNKASQIANENRIRRNFFGSFAKGKAPTYNKINGNIYTDNNGGYYEYDPETKKYNKIDIKDGEGRKKVASGYKNAIASSGPVGAISEGAKTLAGGIMDFINGIMGKNDKKAQEQEKKNIFASIKQSFIDAGNEKGALGIGAITGVGVSLLTGAVVGPLAGAAIGAGVGLAAKSQAFQDLLFGKGDPESDDYRKGLLGSIGEKLKDKNNQAMLKNMGIGGGAGLIAGTFMGSPILGLVAGSTIGYVSKSQKAQEFLFGTEDEKTALGELRDKVKKASPNIAAGALAGLIAGPFGVVGNLLIGSGLGYMTTSERFKKFMFGDGEKDKGLVGKIHDKIINPLDEIMHNLGNAIAGFTRRLGANILDITKKFGNMLKRSAKGASEKDNFLGKVLRGVGNVGEKVIGGTVDAVGGVLDRVDTGLKKSNLNTGSSVYNKALGRNETAAERMQTRQTIRNGGVATEQDANGNTIYYKVNANGKKTLINEKKYNNIIAKNEKRGGYHENRKFGKIDEAISGMDEETINNLTNKNNKEDARLKLAEILGKDVDKIKNSDLAQFISLLGDEKSGRFSKEDKEKDKETKQNTMLDTINDNIPKATNFLEEIRDKILGKKSKKKAKGKGQTDNLGNDGDQLEDKGEETVTQTDMFGNIHQYTKNNQGELTEVNNDNETKKSRKLINSFTENIGGIGKIGAALGGIGGVLGAIKKGLLGDGEKKPGLLSKLFDGLFGEEGAISGILSLFTGEKGSLKTIVKGIFSKGGASIFKTMLTDIGIGALIYAGFSGKLDSIVSSITGLVGGKGAEDAFASKSKDKTTTYDVTLQDGTTTTASKDADGNFVDASGNILNVKSVDHANQNNVASFSDKLKENTVRGIVTGTGSVASKMLGKTSVGRVVGSTVNTAVDAIGDSAKVASFADDILNGVIKFTSSLKKIPGLKFMADKLDDMGLALAEKIQPILMSQSAKSISNFAANAVVWIKVAYIVVDFTTGYEDARTTLGIVKEPTVGQRVLSGLLRAIKNFIPIVGSLIPDSLVIDVFCNYIAPALGIDVDELKNAREEAQETVDSYNQATGNNLSVAEFTKSVMKDYTWTERIGNAAKGTWEDTKTKAKNFGNSIKENGIVGTFKNMGAEAISTFKESFNANGGGISGIISGIGDTFGNMLPGVLGEITKKNDEIRSLAFKGDLKGLWGIGLDDFSGGGEDIEGTDLKTAVPSIFSKIVGQLPLIVNKLQSTPIALVMKVVGKIKDLLGPLKDKIVGGFTNIKDNGEKLVEYVKQGDVSGLWANEAEDDEGNPLGGIYKAVNFIQKLTMTPTTIFCMIGRKIKDAFSKVLNKVKVTVDAVKESFTGGAKMLAAGGDFSFSEFMDTSSITDDPENPIGGIGSTLVKVGRLVSLPAMLVAAVGKKIKDAFGKVVDKVKTSVINISQDYMTVQQYAKAGDVQGLWSSDLSTNDDPENPVGGFTRAINTIQKVTSTPMAAVMWVGNKIKDAFIAVKDKVVTGFQNVANNYVTLHQISKTGDLSGLWSNEIQDDQENPLGGIYKAVNFIQKISMTPVTLFRMIGGKIKDGFIAMKDKIVNSFTAISENYISLAGFAKQGDLSGLWSNEITDDEENPLGGIFKAVNFVQKISMTPITLFKMIGGKIKDGFITMKDKVVNGYAAIMDNYGTITGLAKEGDVSGIWANEITDDEENPLGGIFKAVNFVQKIAMTPTGIFHLVGNKIKEALHLEDIKADAGTFGTALQDLKGAAAEGDLDKIWSTEVKFSENNPVKAIFNVGITINKLLSSVVAIINKIVGPIKDLVGGVADTVGAVKDKVGDTVGNVKEKVSNAWNGAKEKVSNAADKVKNTASNLWNSATNFISGAFGGSSGFVSQYDHRYQKYQVSGQQFGAKGCGPAVASMAASALGKNLSVGDAVRASNGYQTNNGVTLDYFQNALGSRGINTEIIAGGSSADMYRKIASGEKVILLGQDATNTSKKNSPFGPNNHYVLATGVDRRGNIIVNDPESKGPRTYSPNILAHAKYGIAGSNSGIRANRTSKIFRLISGAGNPRNDAITQQVWAYLTTKLGMSEAAAAGIMGNMEQESGCQPDIKQKGGGAYGICQWDGGRRDKLKQFPNYQSLNVQLDYLASELPSQYWKKSGTINDVDGKSYSYKSMSYDDFKKLNDVAEATIKFEAAFERAGKPHLAKRINYAKAYYEMFTGKTYAVDPNVGTATSSGATNSSTSTTTTGSTGSSKSGGILNILSTITSAFSNAFRGGTNEPATKENSQETQTTGMISNSSSSSALVGTGNPATGDMVNNFPYYNQGEDPWKGETYGTGTIKSSGCGPTSMAMVMKSYGSNVTPSDTAKWSVENGYRIPNQGTSWGFFKGIGDKSGLDVSQFGSSETAKQSLLAGIPVIGSMKPGDFTKGGHYIVFSGISKDGSQVYVNDPASRSRSGKVWDTNNAFSQAKQFWAISKNGKGSIKDASAAGSGILSYGDLAMAAGGSSGLLMSSRAGANTPGVATFRDSRTGRLLPVRVSGGESDIVGMTSTMLNNVKTSVSNAVSKAKSGTVSAELVAELLKSITNILNNIADNTAPVAKIYNALAAYISSGGGASMDKVTVKKKPETPVAGGGSSEVDSNIAALAGVLAELAKG